jgi:hypothetical protein
MRWLNATAYFALFSVTFSALVVSRILGGFQEATTRAVCQRAMIGVWLFVYFPLGALNINSGLSAAHQTARDADPARYQEVARWLTRNTRLGELVVADARDFPNLYFINPHNTYVLGPHPLFSDVQAKRLGLVHQLLYQGRIEDPAAYLRALGGTYLFLNKREPQEAVSAVYERAIASGQFSSVYSDAFAQVLALNTPYRLGHP